jgi:predicted transglutaminase-like cysteine proteinase
MCAIGLAVALVLAFVSAVAAKSPRRDLPPEAAPLSEPRPPAPGPARFFTINEIMSKRDNDPAGAGGRTAAVERGNSASDAADPARRRGGPEPFGLYSFRAPDGLLWSKWRALEADLAAEAKDLALCRERRLCDEAATRYLAILEEIRTRQGRARLETANRLFNGAIRYMTDLEQHRAADRWHGPLAALTAGRGDCEEYAIAKYVALRDAGVPEGDLRLVLVRDTAIRVDHAVLAVRFEERWLVLDNRRTAATETDDLRHYLPMFAVDREGVKLFAAPYAMWGEGGGEFAEWSLRGAEYASWTLRGSDAEPAGAGY